MKTLFIRLFLALFVSASLASCIAPREVNESACVDPEYLRLKTIPIDSMTPRQYAYYQMKDKECEEAYSTANAVHQQQTGEQENIFLGIGIVAAILVIDLLANSTTISL